MFVNDALSLFFKQLFIVAAILVLFMAAEFSDKLAEGSVAEYYSLILFALAGMLFAASSNDFTMLFVSLNSSRSRFMSSSVFSAANFSRLKRA